MPPTRTRVGARDDQEVRVGARGHRLLELLRAKNSIGTRWSMPTWCSTRRGSSWSSISIACEARGLRQRDGAVHVHRIAPAAAGVEHDRQLADRAHVDRDLGHLRQRQFGLGDALEPAERAAGEIDRLEAGLLGHARHDRVERDRRDDEVVAADEVLELCQIELPCLTTRASRIVQQHGETGGKAQGHVRALDACGGAAR